GPRRSHSSVPTRMRKRPARGVAVKDGPLGPPEGLVLDGREHAGRLARVVTGGEPALVVERGGVGDRGVAAAAIVEPLDELEERQAGLGLCLEATAGKELAFECCEEAFAHCVVVGVADRAHRGAYARFSAALAELERRVLAALVG